MRFRSASFKTIERFRQERWSTGAGESHGSPEVADCPELVRSVGRTRFAPGAESLERDPEAAPDTSDGGRGTTLVAGVRPCAAAFTIAGSDESPLVLTVFKLLSIAFAVAVFLFASARSRRSMVSCVVLAASAVFFSFPQARLPAQRRSGTAIENLESVFIGLPEVDRIRLVGQRPCHTGALEMQLTSH